MSEAAPTAAAHPTPELEPTWELRIDLAPNHEMGRGRFGTRRIIPILGGEVGGPGIEGRILPIGADWQTVTQDDVAELTARYAFELADGALIEVQNKGVRHASPEIVAAIARGDDVDPSEYYMRTSARLETGADSWRWVNRTLFLGTGSKRGNRVHLSLFAVR